MYTIEKQWKEFNISVSKLEEFVKAQSSEYVGCSANSRLELHFETEPSQEAKEAIDSHYESLDGSDYVSAIELATQESELEAAIETKKLEVITKTWDQMSVVERKVAVGLKPTRTEMGLE